MGGHGGANASLRQSHECGRGDGWTDSHLQPSLSLQEKVRLRYKLTFALGEQLSTELGEVDQFPPVEQWGNL